MAGQFGRTTIKLAALPVVANNLGERGKEHGELDEERGLLLRIHACGSSTGPNGDRMQGGSIGSARAGR